MSINARPKPLARQITIVALFTIGLLPAALMLYFVTSNWLPLPFGDEWDTPGGLLVDWCRGTLTFGELFHQHNESRKFFPALLYLCLAKLGGWDVRATMVVLFVSVCAIAALTYRLLRQTPSATTLSALIAWLVVMFLCFSGSQFENFLWGIQLEPIFPGLAILAVIAVNTSKFSFHCRTICNIGLALVATYTFANGMLLWVLGVPLLPDADESSRKYRIRWCVVYAASGLISIGSYFIGYVRSSMPFASVTADISKLTHYLVLWAGSYLMTPSFKPQIAGISAIVFFVAAICAAIISVLRKRNWRTFYPVVLIGAYACITAAVTAVGRLEFGVEEAIVVRYLTFSLFFYLAVVVLVHALYCAEGTGFHRTGRLLSHLSIAIVGLAALILWIDCYRQRLRDLEAWHENRAQLLLALEWIDVIPHNPDLASIYPDPEKLRNYARVLSECKMLRLPFVSDSMASAMIKRRPFSADASHGQLESCYANKDGNLLFSGWTWLPQSNRPADCIVLGVENAISDFELITVLGTGTRRPDLIAQAQNQRPIRAGFSYLFNYQNAEQVVAGTIRALAIDLQEQKAYLLAGECEVRNQQKEAARR